MKGEATYMLISRTVSRTAFLALCLYALLGQFCIGRYLHDCNPMRIFNGTHAKSLFFLRDAIVLWWTLCLVLAVIANGGVETTSPAVPSSRKKTPP